MVLADFITTYLDFPPQEKQEILEVFDTKARLKAVGEKLAERLKVLELSRKIGQRTKGSMDKAQREYYLREQLKSIQSELGEADSKTVDIRDLSEKITEARLPDAVEKEARRDLAFVWLETVDDALEVALVPAEE